MKQTALWRLWRAYRLRWKRRYLLVRSLRKRKQLTPLLDRTAQIKKTDILLFSTVRNEALRLPWFMEYHRALGVKHFLFVDNASDDGTSEYLRNQPDTSVWQTSHSYKASRFGVDWLTCLQVRYGVGHWCLTLDADELLVYPHHDRLDLPALTQEMERTGQESLRVLMLDLYPKNALSQHRYKAGEDPLTHLHWFDAENFVNHPRPELATFLTRGGVRARAFFGDQPDRAPTMNKIPLVKWRRSYAYLDSTHSALPRRLNTAWSTRERPKITGALLHTKFLHCVVEKSAEEQHRQEHFSNSALYDTYYDALTADPILWSANHSTRYVDWEQLEEMGLLSTGSWSLPT